MSHSLGTRKELAIIIPAAGFGDRLGLGPKALLQLNGKPIIYWLTQKALQLSNKVVVAYPPNHEEKFKHACPECTLVEGGSSRQQTIEILFEQTHEEIILLQDAARPFATRKLLQLVVEAAVEHGVAGAFLTPEVPIAQIKDGIVLRQFDKSELGINQSPQAFRRKILKAAIIQSKQNNSIAQSTLQLVHSIEETIHCVPGERANIKITTPEDWAMAQHLTGYLL